MGTEVSKLHQHVNADLESSIALGPRIDSLPYAIHLSYEGQRWLVIPERYRKGLMPFQDALYRFVGKNVKRLKA